MKTLNIKARTLLHVAAVLLTVGMIAVLGRAMRRDGPAALEAWRAAHVQWPWLAASVLLALTGHALYVYGWQRLVRDSGGRAPFFQLARMFLVSNLGRYLPGGKAWQMAIIAMMAAERNLPSALLAATSLFQGVLGVAVGAIVVFAAGGATIGLPWYWLILPIAGVLGLVIAPAVIRAIPSVHMIAKRYMPAIDTLTAATTWTLIWTSVGSWVLWGIALGSLAHAVLPPPGVPVNAYIAAWSGSFLAGIIAIVTPAGLGAREEVMRVVLTRAGMSAASTLVLVIVARAWVTLLDVVPAAAVLLIRRWHAHGARNDALGDGLTLSGETTD